MPVLEQPNPCSLDTTTHETPETLAVLSSLENSQRSGDDNDTQLIGYTDNYVCAADSKSCLVSSRRATQVAVFSTQIARV